MTNSMSSGCAAIASARGAPLGRCGREAERERRVDVLTPVVRTGYRGVAGLAAGGPGLSALPVGSGAPI